MKKITVYTKNGCPQCDMTKAVLSGEGVEFEIINVEDTNDDGTTTEKAQKAYDYVVNTLGLRQMPVVLIEGEEPFTGFQPDRLQGLI
jgi:glutaredoxin-like protein NrdH